MSVPTPQPIADWLEKLGLGQYTQRFVENEITLSILPNLTDADLKEQVVSALGHRRLLLRLPGQTALFLGIHIAPRG
jgi:hypothetical protein